MSNRIVIPAVLLSAFAFALTGSALAQQAAATSKEAQIAEMGSARANAQIAIQDLQKPLDFSLNGFLTLHNEISALNTKIADVLAKAIAEENAKPIETRNNTKIYNYMQRTQKLTEEWAAYGRKKAILDARVAEAIAAYQNLGTSFGQLAGYDIQWMRAGIEIKPLTEIFKAVERRVLALRAESVAIVAEQEKNLAEWKSQLNSAEAMVISK